MPTFKALSYGAKWRVTRLVARGEAPDDPRMAAAAVELAEHCQRSQRAPQGLLPGLLIGLVIVSDVLAIFAAAKGDPWVVGSMSLIALSNVGHLILNPRVRPKSVSRSLKESKRVVAARV